MSKPVIVVPLGRRSGRIGGHSFRPLPKIGRASVVVKLVEPLPVDAAGEVKCLVVDPWGDCLRAVREAQSV